MSKWFFIGFVFFFGITSVGIVSAERVAKLNSRCGDNNAGCKSEQSCVNNYCKLNKDQYCTNSNDC